MNYWRIGSWSKKNVEIAFEEGEWGAPSTRNLKPLGIGDFLIFYVTRGQNRGYWGIAMVSAGLFTSDRKIWMDGDYPYRISIKPIQLRQSPLGSEVVRPHLETGKLRYQRQSGVIQLTPKEFDLLENLIKTEDMEGESDAETGG